MEMIRISGLLGRFGLEGTADLGLSGCVREVVVIILYL